MPASVGPPLSTETLTSGRPPSTASRSGKQEAATTIAAAAAPVVAPSHASLRPKSECTCVPLPYRAAGSCTIGSGDALNLRTFIPPNAPRAKAALR